MRFKDSNSLNENDILARSLYDEKGRLLLSAGNKLSNKILKKLRRLDIDGIYVDDEISKGINIDPIINHNLKNSMINRLISFNIDNAMEDAKDIVNLLVSHSGCNDYFNKCTSPGKRKLYEHSLNVAVFSTMIGISCNFSMEELKDIALAGLLHDIGMTQIDDSIIDKPDKLTDDEYKKVKEHPKIGYEAIKDSQVIHATVKMGVYEHHENEDGTGYPREIKDKDIYKFAKIIHIVDVYDAMTNPKPYRKSYGNEFVRKYIRNNKGIMFDGNYVDVFLNIVPVYPRGTIVKLNNNEKAIVLKNHPYHIYRPTIRLIKNHKEIDLSNSSKNLSIICEEKE